jgi:hypothetical protein
MDGAVCRGENQNLGATIYDALGLPLEARLGRDGFTRPVSTGLPILELSG